MEMPCSAKEYQEKVCWKMSNYLEICQTLMTCSRLWEVDRVRIWPHLSSSRSHYIVVKPVRTTRAAAVQPLRRQPSLLLRQRQTCWTTICSSPCSKRWTDRANSTIAMPFCLVASLAQHPTSPATCKASPRSTTSLPD